MNVVASSSRRALQSFKSKQPRLEQQFLTSQQSRSSSTDTRPRSVFARLRPLESAAAATTPIKGGKGDSLWQSWLNLRPSTRLLYGSIVAIIAVGGLKVSDVLQQKMPAPGEEQSQGSAKGRPKLIGFSVVDRRNP